MSSAGCTYDPTSNIHNNIKSAVLLLLCLCTWWGKSYAEGSKDLYPSGASGYRAYVNSTTASSSTNPFPTLGTVKVYVKAGETIYVGSSAQAVGNGTINLRAPNGNTYTTGNGSLLGLTVGRIYNRTQELAGPVPLGGGYTPATFPVLASEEGVWEIDFVPPSNTSSSNPTPVLANAAWTQPTSGNYIAAFDVSVRNAGNTAFINGRVYTNIFSAILGDFTAGFNAVFQVLTKDGFIYSVNNNGQAGNGFSFFVNNKGFRNSSNGASYKSYNSLTSIPVQDPRADDTQSDITQKIFFTTPASDMPATAPGVGGTEWLRITPVSPVVSNFTFNGVEGTPNVAGTNPAGGNIGFTTNQAGNYAVDLDINNNGVYSDSVDRRITGIATAGANTAYWDGLDGKGVRVSPTVVSTANIPIRVLLFGGEIHFPFLDVERNVNGIIITRTNGSGSGNNVVYWDDSNISPVVGTASNPIRTTIDGISSATNGHKWGTAGAGSTEFGDVKGLDTWTYVLSNALTNSTTIVIREADLQVVSVTGNATQPCVGQSVTFTVPVKNNGPDNVTGAKFFFAFPAEFTNVTVSSAATTGTSSVSGGATTATGYTANVNINNGATVTFTITGTLSAVPSGGSLTTRASIMRPADVTDPDATNPDAAAPTDPQNECDAAPSGVGCNNVINNTILVFATPTTAAAGTDQNLCAATSTTLAGNTPVNGTGTWTKVSGPGTPVFVNPNSGGTVVNGITTGTYIFRWTITNGGCAASTSDVQVFNLQALASNTITAPATTTFCSSGDAAVITGSTPTGGTGTYTYQWQSSTDATNYTNISGATAQTYDPPVATVTTYYRRGVTSGACATVAYSNVATITIQPALAGNTITAPAVTAFCTSGDAAVINGSTATGGNGTISYQWQSSTDSVTFTNISGITTQSYDPGATSVTTYYRRTATSGSCTTPSVSNVVTITVSPTLTAGSIGSDQAFCVSGDPAAFTQLTAATGGTGTYAYQWQISTTSSTSGFTNISGATAAVYDAPAVSQNTWFRRITSSGTCTDAISNAVAVTIYAALNAGTISASQTFCTSGDPAAFTQTAPAGGNGSYTYQWQTSADNNTFTNITGATASVYDAPVVSQTTYYRRTVTAGTCAAVNSNVLTVTVVPAVTNNTVTGDQTICSGTAPASLSGSTPANGTGTYVYQWQSSTDGTTFIAAAGTNTTQNYTPGNLTQTTYYRRTVSSGVCAATASNIIQVTVNGASTGANAGPDQGPANITSATLAGNNPVSGTGVWTQISGPNTAGITSPSQFNTTVTGLVAGAYTFRWTITNPPCAASTDDVIIRVNSAPVAQNDAATTNEDVAVNISVLSNDTDADGTIDATSVTIVQQPAHGTVTVNATGVVTYTPALNYNGADNFSYTVKDNLGTASAPATVTLTIAPVNDAPVVVNDQVNVDEDIATTINAPGILANDSDPDGDQLITTLVSTTKNGTLTLNQNGSFTYTPNADYNGLDSFVYRACDASNACGTATVVINVGNVNDAPVAAADTYTIAEDGTLNQPAAGVLANDTDADGDVLSATLVTNVAHGTLVLNTNGSFSYTPDANYNGPDQFTYKACDASGACSAPVTVSFTVTAVNDKPVAQDNSYAVNEDQTLTVAARGVLLDDTDVDGDVLSASVVTGPQHGTLVLNADGSFTYTPVANYNGTDQFTYRACDAGSPQLCDTGLVTITVNAVNDAPVATADTYAVAEDQALNIAAPGVLGNDTDADGDALTAAIAVAAANGTVTLQPNGSFLYRPNANFNGTDSFSYSVCDPSNVCGTGKVRITVTPVNDTPVVITASYVATEDQVLSVVAPGLIANGSDVDGDALAPALVTQAQHGTVVINANGSFTYTPVANYNGTDVFTYRLCDASGACGQATATITVNAVNDAPVAARDNYTVAEDGSLQIGATNGVLANDTDADGDALTATVVTQPVHGTLVMNSDGSFVYTPAGNYNGTDSFTYRACDASNACGTATVVLNVTAVNDAPVASGDSYTIAEDGTLTVAAPGVLFNDRDVDGDALTASLVSQPLHGTLSLNADGSFVYTPAANYNGTDSFLYRACDAGGLCNTATVLLSVTAVNDAPVANSDAYTLGEDTALTVAAPGVLGNDTDADGDALTASVTRQPAHGTLTLLANGGFTYTPALNYNGRDSFDYRACDASGACSAPATVVFTINAVNDAPVIAGTVTYSTQEDAPLNVTAPGLLFNASDPENDAMSAAVATQPQHGTVTINANGSFVYTPAANYNGTDTFTYRICDASNACSIGTAVISITAVNDAPVAGNDVLPATLEDVPVTIAATTLLANDTDAEGDALTISINTQPVNGTLVQNADGSLTYTPAANFNGVDSFTYRVCDNGSPALCGVGTVRIPVTAVNDAPVAKDDQYTTNEDGVLTVAAPGVLFNDSDPDNAQNTLTASLVSGPAHGTAIINANGGFTYTPDANYDGQDTITYRVCDPSGACDTGIVVISVQPVNDPPVTAADNYTNVQEDVPFTVTAANGVLANDTDADGDVLNASVVTSPAHGTLVLNSDGSFTYTPAKDYNGLDSFTYKACDAAGSCGNGKVYFTVNNVNDAPVTAPVTYTTNEDVPLTLTAQQLLFNDMDADGDPLTITGVTQPVHGTVTLNGNGTYTYTPAADYNGVDSFTYTVTDGQGGLATGTVLITVNAVNDAPVAQNDSYTLDEEQTYTSTVSVLANDTDVDGDALTAALLAGPLRGTVTLNANGNFTYTPAQDYNGLDSFTYVVSDGRGGLDTGVVTLTVTAINDNPVANRDTYTTREDVALSVVAPGILFNDTDPDNVAGGTNNDVLTATAESKASAAGGTVQINSNGSFIYTPSANYNGLDSFTYTLQDGKGGTATGTVVVTVQADNDAPVAVDDSYTVAEDVILNVNAANGLLANDTDADGDALTVALLTPPAHGVTTVNADGSFAYRGNTNYNGSDFFTYVVRDGNGGSDTGTVQITVTAVDDPPVAQNDNYYLATNDSLIIAAPGVLFNDVDVDSPLNAELLSSPASGAFSFNSDGSFRYVPVTGFAGTVTFSYRLCTTCTPATVTINVGTNNRPPLAAPDSYSTSEDVPLTVAAPGVLANDTDPDEATPRLAAVLVTTVSHGTLTLNANGSFTYVPEADYNGADNFTYAATDANGATSQTTVFINVTATNDAPVAAEYNVSTAEDTQLNGSVATNTTDVDNSAGSLLYTVVANPAHGSLSLNANGTYTYTPAADYNGPDQFSYRVCDAGGLCDDGTVAITVTAVNDAPVSQPDSYTVTEDQQLVVPAATGVLANDSDVDAEPIVSVLASTTNGTLNLQPDGSFTYTPNPDFSGIDQFTYQACDNGTPALCGNPVTVTLTVNNVNDAPDAGNDSYTMAEDGTLTIAAPGVLANDTDGDNDPLTAAVQTQPLHGTLTLNADGSFVYAPAANYNGTDVFTYRVSDGNGGSDTAQVTITITPVNDQPVAGADTYTVIEDSTLEVNAANGVLANDIDVDGEVIVAKLTDPSKGTLTLRPDGSFTYVPLPNATGVDSFRYQACDVNQCSDPVTVIFNFTDVNDAPVAVADSATTAEDTPLTSTVSVLANDTDADGTAGLTVTAQTITDGRGTLTMGSDGNYTYTPASNFNGQAEYPYQVCDPTGLCAQGRLVITVTPVNDAPVATPDTYAVTEDSTLTVPASEGVLANDYDPDGETIVSLVSQPSRGTLQLNADGSFIYTPQANAVGVDSFSYRACDLSGVCSPDVTVYFTIGDVNDAPVANADQATVPEDSAVNINVLANDTDPDQGQTLTATLLTQPANGTVVQNPDGTFRYTPAANFNGTDQFTYQVCDNGSPQACASATVSVTVTAVNDAPVAAADAYAVNEDETLTVTAPGVLGNDVDADGDALVVSLQTNALHGTVTLQGDGSFTYVPVANYNGLDSFVYKVTDGAGDTSLAIVRLTVNAVNDAPTAAGDGPYTVNEDAVLNVPVGTGVLANDTDTDGGTLTASVAVAPLHGTLVMNADGSFTYTPNADYSGTDTFTYRVCNSSQLCSESKVSLSIQATPDSPVVANDTYAATEDTRLQIAAPGVLANDRDADGDALRAAVAVAPLHGTLTLQPDGSFEYTPAANYNGVDSFTYTACDAGGLCNTGTVVLNVAAVKDVPQAVADNITAQEDVPLVIRPVDLTANDINPDGDPLVVTFSQPANGTLTQNQDGSFTYTPDADFNGTDQFTYTVCDTATPANCSSATVSVSVGAVNDNPVAGDDSYTATEDTDLFVGAPGVMANDRDVDGDPLTTSLVTGTAHGTVTLQPNGSFLYKPARDYSGADSFIYRLCGPFGTCVNGTVRLSVTAVNDAPVAIDDDFVVTEDQAITFRPDTVLYNDYDVDGDVIIPQRIGTLKHGTVVNNPDGTLTYTPEANFNGIDSIQYKLCDPSGLCDTAYVRVRVVAVNDAPVAVNDNFTTREDVPLNFRPADVTANDSDPDGDPLTLVLVSGPSHGTLTTNPDKSYVYTPATNYNGADSIVYRVYDQDGAFGEGVIRIQVSAVNDAPVAQNDVFVTPYNTPVSGNVLTNDSDPDGDPLQASLVAQPSSGTVVLNADGTFTYTPAGGFSGNVTFSYRACDNGNPPLCDAKLVNITVQQSPNRAPVSQADSYTTISGIALSGNVLTNDTDADLDSLKAAVVNLPANGTLVLNANGNFTYTPSSGFTGVDTFVYSACDNKTPALCSNATVTINVIAGGSRPVAVNDLYTIAEDGVLNISAPGVLQNDVYSGTGANDTLVASLIGSPAHGTATISGNGAVTYTPAANYNGKDTILYSVCSATKGCDTGRIIVTVSAVNDVPVTGPDTYGAVQEDTPFSTTAANGVLANDTDGDGDVLTASVVTAPVNGTLVMNPDGSFTYTPFNNFNGVDSFVYRACDASGTCTNGTVRLTVNGVNDGPVTSPVSYTVDEDNELVLTQPQLVFNDRDDDGDTLVVTAVGQPAHGTLVQNGNGTYTYKPAADYNGLDSFTYTVSDGHGGTATGTVRITVRAVNDRPDAANDTYTLAEDQAFTSPVSVLANDTDRDGDTLRATVLQTTAHGNLLLNNDGTFTYQPNRDYNGTDTFTYIAADGKGGMDTARVILNITAVNDAPVANSDTYTVNEDETFTATGNGVLFNDVDPDNGSQQGLSVTPQTKATAKGGTVQLLANGTFTYTPPANYNGVDSFTYIVTDGNGGSSTGTVVVTVQAVNDAPVAVNDSYTLAEDETLSGAASVLANDTDADGDALTAILVAAPAHGTLTFNANGTFVYTPDADFSGTDTFRYAADDGNGGRDTATVTFTITAVDDAPVATDDNYFTAGNSTLTIAAPGVLFNDRDSDSPLSAELVTSPAAATGTLTFNTDGSFVFVPATGYVGTVTFTYRLCSSCTPALVTINVGANNLPPVAVNDGPYTVNEDSVLNIPAANGVLANDTDPNEPAGATLAAILVTDVTHGRLTLRPDGSFSYTPDADYSGPDSFTYDAKDANGETSRATVTLNVTAVNDAPVAVNDVFTGTEDNQLTGNVLTNDVDVDNTPATLTVTLVNNVQHGTLTLNANGTFTYVPAPDFAGTDQFRYRVCDAGGLCSEAVATINVTDVNDVAVAQPDTYAVTEDAPLTVPASSGVLANDSDPDSPLTAKLVSGPAHGTLQLNPDGSFTYTPNANYSGADQFSYQACDNGTPPACSAPVTVAFNIANTNDVPVAVSDSYSVGEDSVLTIAAAGVLLNDTDADGDTLTAVIQVAPAHGTLVLNANGGFVYTPDANYFGTDQFTYLANDGKGGTANAQVTITIRSVNDIPVGSPDVYAVSEDSTLTVNAADGLLKNDTDADGDVLIAKLVTAPKGRLTLNNDGSFVYRPLPDQNGVDSFTYQVCDVRACSSPVTVRFNIAAVNDAPVAVNDTITIDEDVVYTSTTSVLANDTDADGTAGLTVAPQQITDARGTLTLNNDGNYIFTPVADFNGTVEYSYQVCDGTSLCSSGKLVINVMPVNDAPLIQPDGYTVQQPDTLRVTAANGVLRNDRDADSDPVTAILVTPPTSGTLTLAADGSFTYIPAAGFSGNVTFVYRGCDNATPALCDTALVTITVQPAANLAPVAVNDTVTVAQNGSATGNILANDTDPDGGTLSASVVTQPAHGTLTLGTNGAYTYAPAAGYSGLDTFVYRACDNGTPSLCDTALVLINVLAPGNNAPVAVNDTVTVAQNSGTTGNVLTNDSDPEGGVLTASVVTQPAHGTLVLGGDGAFTYSPATGYSGLDTFSYRACDGGIPPLCDTAIVIVRVQAPGNTAPVAADDTATVAYNGNVTGNVLTNDIDPDGNTLAASVITQPAHGTLVLNGNGSYTYTAATGYSGQDTFVYRACDNGTPTLCDTARVVVTVQPSDNQVPVVVNDTVTVAQNGSTTGNVLANDSDPDGGTLTASVVTQPSHGTLVLGGDGAFTYTPAAGYSGLDTFSYRACDNGAPSFCDTAIVIVRIQAPGNTAPVAADDTATVAYNGTVTGNVLTNDIDPDGNTLTASVIVQTNHGTLVLNSNGAYTYTPAAGYTGKDTLVYRVCDNGTPTLCDTARMIITVQPAGNLAPVALADTATVIRDGSVTRNVLTNDSDPEGGTLTASVVTQPFHGTLTLNAAGDYTYTPAAGYIGQDTFVYRACDNGSPVQCDTALVVISVLQQANRAPNAENDLFVVAENATLTNSVTTNDTDADGNMLTATVLTQPKHGTLTMTADGTFTYAPGAQYVGNDTFSYRICDNGTPSLCDTASVVITVRATPVLGLAKAVSDVRKELDGSYTITYKLTVKNLGGIALNNVQVTDGLTTVFAGAASFNVTGVPTATGTLIANDGFNGRGVVTLLRAGSTLAPGAADTITFRVNVMIGATDFTFNNTATVTAGSATGTILDVSTDGLNPDPNGNGIPDERDPTPVTLKGMVIKIPKGFSPNNDGINDYFIIENTGTSRISLEMYNRWGNLVYKSTDYKNNWDGRPNTGITIGKQVPDGTYYYIVVVDGKDRYVNYITINR